MAQAFSSNRILQKLLFLQLILVFFQLGLRHFVDSTLVRDICLILAIVISLLSARRVVPRDGITGSVWLYLCYGILIMSIHSLTGASVVSSVTQFRNFFLPLAIVPISKCLFVEKSFRLKLVKFIFALFVILLADVYVEYIFQLIGLSRDVFPWYPFQYTHIYRFSTAPDAIPGAINPEQAPILGIQGWPLNTSATLLGLYAFVYPLIMDTSSKSNVFYFQNKFPWVKYLWLILVAGALLILQVKMTMIAFIALITIHVFSRKGKVIKDVILISTLFLLVAALTKDLWVEIFQVFSDEFAEGEMDYILSAETLGNLFSVFFSGSPIDLFFGADFSHLPNFENLEIRLLVFTLELGIIWLIFYLIINIRTLRIGKRLLKKGNLETTDSLLVKGIQLSLITYLIDMLHYANQMYLFNIFFFGVMLALMSSLIIQNRNANSISNSSCL